MTDVNQRSKMDCSLLFLCFQNNLIFALYIGHLPSRQSLHRLQLLVHGCFLHPGFSSLGAQDELVQKIIMTQRVKTPSPQCDLRDLLTESFPNACFDSWMLLDPQTISRCSYELFVVCSLHGIAASIGMSNFFLCFSGFFELHIIRIKKKMPLKLTRIVEIRFLDGPLSPMEPNGNHWALNCFSKSPFIRCFLCSRRSWTFRKLH